MISRPLMDVYNEEKKDSRLVDADQVRNADKAFEAMVGTERYQ